MPLHIRTIQDMIGEEETTERKANATAISDIERLVWLRAARMAEEMASWEHRDAEQFVDCELKRTWRHSGDVLNTFAVRLRAMAGGTPPPCNVRKG